MVSVGAEFSEVTVGMAGLCSAMSGASDQRLLKAEELEAWKA